jgi:RNA polymerase sigma-70 factor, ECF subfamily
MLVIDPGLAIASPDDPDQPVESTLAGALASGDSEAFERVVRDYRRPVAALAHRLLGWPDDVDDAVQEVFLAVLRNRERFRGESKLGTWITRITLNVCRTYRRRLICRLRLVKAWRMHHGEQSAGASSQAAEINEVGRSVRSAIRRLGPADREIIVLRYLEQRELNEIAQLLGVTPGALDVRLHRARQRLGKLLEQDGVSLEDR